MDNVFNKIPKKSKKTVITIVGSIVVVIGIILIPYPGPGWLVVFAGLSILAKEYPWAGRVLHYGRTKYDDWNTWIRRQNILVQSMTFIATSAIVVVTLWLVNTFGMINHLFNLGLPWLVSPLFR